MPDLGEVDRVALLLGAAAAGAAALWLLLLGVVVTATRPRTPEPLPAGLEPGGDEPAAVVNLLTCGWRLEPEAMAATLVDLAARGTLALERAGLDQYTVRVGPTAADGLTGYERQVWDHVRKLGGGGAVPLAALNEGGAGDHGWWKRFEKAVIADARDRGLSRNRFGKALAATLSATALIPAGLAGAAAVAAVQPADDDAFEVFGATVAVVWIALLALFRSRANERDTDAGLAAAGRWLGLRENLQANPMFATLPPTAIAVWNRYLAHATAMGLATGIVRSIPYGEQESARRAWSAVGGEWRLVRIRYPDHIPPKWGRSPAQAVALGLVLAAAFGFLLVGVIQVVWPAIDDLPVEGTWLRTVLLGLAVALAVLTLRGLVILALGLSDIGQGRAVEGRVVRLRTSRDGQGNTVGHAVAVDDGTSDEIRAWKLRVLPPGVSQGAWVRALVTPQLGFVRSLEAVAAADGEAPAQESSRF